MITRERNGLPTKAGFDLRSDGGCTFDFRCVCGEMVSAYVTPQDEGSMVVAACPSCGISLRLTAERKREADHGQIGTARAPRCG